MGAFPGDAESGKENGFFHGGFHIPALDVVMRETADKGIARAA
ncbi:hypothetical protein LTSEALA_5388, partial [Salmonella enterica subsp. enterica serovar Alachua str. R6-377]